MLLAPRAIRWSPREITLHARGGAAFVERARLPPPAARSYFTADASTTRFEIS